MNDYPVVALLGFVAKKKTFKEEKRGEGREIFGL